MSGCPQADATNCRGDHNPSTQDGDRLAPKQINSDVSGALTLTVPPGQGGIRVHLGHDACVTGAHRTSLAAMSARVWARNPDNYIKECIEVGFYRYIFDRGRVESRNIDINAFMDLYVQDHPWESMLVHTLGTMLLDNDHNILNPKAVYPTWEFGQKISRLEDLMMHPVGEDKELCGDKSIYVQERPVYGQDHVIVIQNLPHAAEAHGKKFYSLINEMQQEYPDCTLHIHGSYSFRIMYGMEFKSTDFDPRNDAGLGRVCYPTGKRSVWDQIGASEHWIKLLDFTPIEMKVPRNRCMYNIKSHIWASKYFKEAIKIDTRIKKRVLKDVQINNPKTIVPENKSIFVSRKKQQEGDKFICNLCSLQDVCKFYREGAICIVPGSDGVELSKFFNTRNSDTVIDGLGILMATQTKRLESALISEEENQELNPETTKIINTLFDRGVKLAKLLNPALNGSAVKVNIDNRSISTGSSSTPQGFMAAIVDEFARQGIDRDKITPEMVLAAFEGPEDISARAIEASTVDD